MSDEQRNLDEIALAYRSNHDVQWLIGQLAAERAARERAETQHGIDSAFHRLTVKQRDHAWAESARRAAERNAARATLAERDAELADLKPKYEWLSSIVDAEDQETAITNMTSGTATSITWQYQPDLVAQLADRDATIGRLREAWDALQETAPALRAIPGYPQMRIAVGLDEWSALAHAFRALLAPPAAVGDPEYQRFESHMNRVLNRPPAAVEAAEPDSEPCLCVHQKRHHYPDSCCFATDQIGPYAERCGCRKFEPRPAAQQQPGDAVP